jgi:hypothetical protein
LRKEKLEAEGEGGAEEMDYSEAEEEGSNEDNSSMNEED